MPEAGARTVADALVSRLRDHGVRHIFGYPGGQMTPIYDALYRQSEIRHILARDEQAAAFMADGYARATGRVGVCLAVCGPGVFNAATALATSFTDSIPVLCISGQVPQRGLRTGYYHENDQLIASSTFTKWQDRLEKAELLDMSLATALFTATTPGERPGPVLLEIPLPVLRSPAVPQRWADFQAGSLFDLLPPNRDRIAPLAELISRWERPLILAGGGVISAGAERRLAQLATSLSAPVLHTLMGKAALPADHPYAAGLTWHRATSDVANMDEHFSPLLREADGMLAIGCRFSQAATGSWTMPLPPSVAQIDIDPEEIGRHFPVTVGIADHADAVLRELLECLPPEPRDGWTTLPVPREPWRLPGIDLVGPLRRVLPREAIVAADITRLSYILLAEFPVYAPRSFLHPAGFVPMGHGIPAALGAKAAFPERTVVAIEGDGCFQMCGMELATAVQEKLPIIVVLVNDCCLSLIKSTQERKYDRRFIGVDLVNPDFCKFAEAFGVQSWRVSDDAAFETALQEAIATNEPSLIEIKLG
jgi:acetolactate synthase I/II/III large subunit